jgi:glycosyltransferase involved in cell wall biosynthesis
MVDVLPEALPSTGFVRKLRELKGKVRKQDNLLLYVGRLHREKLVDDLIRMMVYLKDTDVVLHIIGDGPERRSLEQLSHTLGVESSVKFLGMISNEDLPEHYLSARLFVSPYTGTSFREASMCGTQIIAYDTTAIEDKTGIVVVPLRDIEKLANAVRGFLGWER